MQKQIFLDGRPLNDEQGFFHTTASQGWNWNNFVSGEEIHTQDCDEIQDLYVLYVTHDTENVYLLTEQAFCSLAVT